MKKTVIEWQPCMKTGAYIRSNHLLYKGSMPILITYEISTGKRYVKIVRCNNGRVTGRVNGDIIAWAYLPDPYTGEAETAEEYRARQQTEDEIYD